MKNPHEKMARNFAQKLDGYVRAIGSYDAAALCGVSRRSIQLWLVSKGNPPLATKIGVLTILAAHKPEKK